MLQGLLYVPDLTPGDPCVEYARDYVPDSAVRQSNLPPTNYNLIAIAPWFNASCTQSYLLSARYDPLRAFIFYQPSNDTAKPPGPDDDLWDLDDGGEWRTSNHYPIFAVSGALGSEMMYQLSLYSGSLSDVPFGSNISDLYNPDPNDYVRIWTELTVSTPTGLPNVWVFILAVVGVLLAVITLTSLFMHYVWRQRRASLQQRVIRGEVNLEAMGIKRLTVPLAHFQKFPLFTYNYDPPPPHSPLPSPISQSVPASPTTTAASSSPPASPSASSSASRRQSYKRSQARQHQSLDAAMDIDIFVAAASSEIRPGSHSDQEARKAETVVTYQVVSPISNAATPPAPVIGDLDYQPICQICLESFQNRATVIRELPCGHIFHPECIDDFLSHVSSLCPLCKACMLPKGYSPLITNAMVRQERAIRRLRERVDVDDVDGSNDRGRVQSWGSSIKKRLHTATDRLSQTPSFGSASADRESRMELKNQAVLTTPSAIQQPALTSMEAKRKRMAELAGINVQEEGEKAELLGIA